MKLNFLGTRGEIEARTDRHRMHTSLLVEYRRRRVMIDCGEDWKEEVWRLRPRPHAIVLTHAHPDHAWGLEDGAPCPVWAPQKTWDLIEKYPIEERRTIPEREPVEIEGLTFEAFPVDHSIRCPAVGYRIAAGRATIFYCPDVVYLPDRDDALRGVDVYIGDGATVTGSFVRRRGKTIIGHAQVQTQLTWCKKSGVPRMIVTHCGSEIVAGDEPALEEKMREQASTRGVEVQLAYDGFTLML